MRQYFPKTEGQCSQDIKQTVKKAFANKMHHHYTMKTTRVLCLGGSLPQSKANSSISRAKYSFVSIKNCSLCVAFPSKDEKKIISRFSTIVSNQAASTIPGSCRHK